MAWDKQKSYASQLKVFEKQVGLQDQVQRCVPGASSSMRVQPSTSHFFSENYSPVINDVTFYVLLLMVLHFGCWAKIVDIETAFLYGDLKEEIYMECPKGMTYAKKDDFIMLNKCIYVYGLVQAVHQYYKKAVEILKHSSFVGGSIDPCLYIKKRTESIVYVALYIDDNLMVGDIDKGLVLKIVDGLQDYLSCKIKISDD